MANVVLAPVHTRLLKTWTVLATRQVATTAHTGDTSMHQFDTYTLPGASMGPNGRLMIDAWYSATGTAGTKTMNISFGGTAIVNAAISAANLSARLSSMLVNRNSQSSQLVTPPASQVSAHAQYAVAFGSATVDTSADVTILLRGQLANAADSINLEAYIISLLYGA